MTHRRPYRRPLRWEAALARIRKGAGEQFDPDVVDGLVACEPDLIEIRNRFLDEAAGPQPELLGAIQELAARVVRRPSGRRHLAARSRCPYPVWVARKLVLGVSVLAVAVLALTPAAPARRALPAQKIALAAIARLAASGSIDAAAASRYRSAVTRAVSMIPRLPASRATPLSAQLAQAAALAPELTPPRALAVFTQLEMNDNWFARHGPPPPQTDITDTDGVVYRYFPGGFEFHPLANFGALNAAALSKNVTATTLLANALAARGVPEPGGGVGFEYDFDFGGGQAPWLSGFAQAVAAQAFARAAQVDTADSAKLLTVARGGLPHDSGAARPADGVRPVDQALRLRPGRRAECATPVGDLARRLRPTHLEQPPQAPSRPS